MSHFTVMVINTNGDTDVQDVLSPFDENTQVSEYLVEKVSEEDFKTFRDHYTSNDSPDYSKSKNADGEYPRIDMSANASLSDEALYEKFGEDWNDSSWRYENGEWNRYSTYNPKSKWDWYQIGGRWAGFLTLKEGMESSTAPNFSWGWDEDSKNELLKNPLKADSGFKNQIDWEAMMEDGRNKASDRWDAVAKILGVDENGVINQPEFSWLQCRTEKFPDDINKAQEFYHQQPEVVKYKEVPNVGYWSSVEDYNFTKDEYKERGANNNISTYAVLKDGEWIGKGKMGWFGMSSETDEEAKKWSDNFYKNFIKDIPEESFITIVDCHI